MDYMLAMLDRADQMKAVEMLELAQIIQLAVAAGVASVTPVPKQAKRQVNKTLAAYERLLNSLQARATGTVGDRYDARGREIIRDLRTLAQYIEETGTV